MSVSTSRREVRWAMLATPHARELMVVGLVLLLLPLLARAVGSLLLAPATAAGLGRLVAVLSGLDAGPTDIGGAVTSAWGLVSPVHTAYEPAAVLDAIGSGAYGPGGHTHPPSSIVMGVPLLALDYRWWLSYWAVASALALALSMRVLAVPRSIAYPVAAGLCITGPGAGALVTTYPAAALAVAVAWRYRNCTAVGGLALG